jgi:hypothetical protein
MRVRATILLSLVAVAAYAGITVGGRRFLVAPIADRSGSPELVAYRPAALSGATTVTTQASSTPCSGCTATRVKLAGLTLLVGFTLFVGGFALVGRRSEENRRRRE